MSDVRIFLSRRVRGVSGIAARLAVRKLQKIETEINTGI